MKLSIETLKAKLELESEYYDELCFKTKQMLGLKPTTNKTDCVTSSTGKKAGYPNKKILKDIW